MAQAEKRTQLVLRLKLDDEGVFGPGKAALLERIERLGSISAAARDMDMSYRQAWLLVETMNEAFRGPVVSTSQGGRRGGGTVLTATGNQVLACYRSIQRKAEAPIEKELHRMDGLLAARPRSRRRAD